MVSWYAMITKAMANLKSEQRLLAKPFKSDLWNYAYQTSHDFESFLTNCTDEIFDLGCMKSFAYNQLDYLVDDEGSLIVDFVGRFETLESDFARLADEIGLPGLTLPKLNQSSHKHYSEWYPAKTRKLVAERFARDIEAFGYRFEEGF